MPNVVVDDIRRKARVESAIRIAISIRRNTWKTGKNTTPMTDR